MCCVNDALSELKRSGINLFHLACANFANGTQLKSSPEHWSDSNMYLLWKNGLLRNSNWSCWWYLKLNYWTTTSTWIQLLSRPGATEDGAHEESGSGTRPINSRETIHLPLQVLMWKDHRFHQPLEEIVQTHLPGRGFDLWYSATMFANRIGTPL